jgi:molecular chaperone IbpA
MAMTNNLSRRLTDDPAFRNFRNFSVGFDRLFENMLQTPEPVGYPPYNILQTSPGRFLIEVALAGFKKTDVVVAFSDGILTISKSEKSKPNIEKDDRRFHSSNDGKCCDLTSVEYIHRGISKRDFVLTFQLAKQVELEEAKMEDGILMIKLWENLSISDQKYIEIK